MPSHPLGLLIWAGLAQGPGARPRVVATKGFGMRELMLFIASLAAAIVLAALAVLIRPEALLWNAFLWVGTAVFLVACGFLLSELLAIRTTNDDIKRHIRPEWAV